MQPAIPFDPARPNNILKLLNFDDTFWRVSDRAIILNKIDYNTPGYSDALTNSVYAKLGDFNFIARCDCPGNEGLEGAFTEGMICPICKKRSTSSMDAINGHLEHAVWLSAPTAVPGWLHPNVYMQLSRWFRMDKNYSYLDPILNPKLPLPPELAEVVPDKGRGHQFLYDNWDMLMDFFLRHLKKTREKSTPDLERYLQVMRPIIFCRHVPVLSSVLHPIISKDLGKNSRKSVDPGSEHVLSAANALSFLEFAPNPPSKREDIEHIIHTAYRSYIEYLDDIARRRMSVKRSLPRRHVLGVRFHWSFRSVIVPICGTHRYDELHIPWAVGVSNLKQHIIGRLMQRYNHTLGQAERRQARAVNCYDPLIDKIMKDMIAESPWPGLPVLFNRNPSLKRGSIQLLFITEIKGSAESISDNTIGISVLVLKDPNADFDYNAKRSRLKTSCLIF